MMRHEIGFMPSSARFLECTRNPKVSSFCPHTVGTHFANCLGSSGVSIYTYVLNLIAPMCLERTLVVRSRALPKGQKDQCDYVPVGHRASFSDPFEQLRHVLRSGQLPILNTVWSVDPRAHQLDPTPTWAFEQAHAFTVLENMFRSFLTQILPRNVPSYPSSLPALSEASLGSPDHLLQLSLPRLSSQPLLRFRRDSLAWHLIMTSSF